MFKRLLLSLIVLGLELVSACVSAATTSTVFLVVTLNSATGSLLDLPTVALSTSCPSTFAIHRYGVDDATGLFTLGYPDATVAMPSSGYRALGVFGGGVDDIFGDAGTRDARGVCVSGAPSPLKVNAPLITTASGVGCHTSGVLATPDTTLTVGGAAVKLQACRDTGSQSGFALILPDGYMLAGYSNNNGATYSAVVAGIVGRTYATAAGALYRATCSLISGFAGASAKFGICMYQNGIGSSLLPFSITDRDGGPPNYVYTYTIGY